MAQSYPCLIWLGPTVIPGRILYGTIIKERILPAGQNLSAMTTPVFITEEEVNRSLKVVPLVDALQEAFAQVSRGEAALRPRDRVVVGKYVQHTLAAISQSWGLSAVKTYLSGPAGVSFVTVLFSLSQSRQLATIESFRLGQLRTGCATALAVRHLGKGPQNLALFGTGTVAQGQLEALHGELGERLRTVSVYSRQAEGRQQFAHRMEELLGRPVGAAESPRDCLREANLVVTASASSQPVFSSEELGEGGVICAVGGNWAHKREIDAATVERCRAVFVDDLAQARVEAGELLQLTAPAWDSFKTLADLVSAPAELPDTGWVLFKSLGVGLEDLAAAYLLAKERIPALS
jgi:ornithine cyclodeaminase/alanine dehydrogenase-like protein (mu-crystallin family)